MARVLTRTDGRQPGLLQRCGGTVCPPGTCDHDDRLSLQRLGYGRAESAIPPVVNRVLQSAGTPLDAATRTIMEPRLGHRFAQVRIHTDAAAAEAASAVNAFAFAVGRDVVFGANRYQPGTGEGRRLLAHELTHVIQQDGSTNSVSRASVASEPADPDEREATDVAQSFDATSDAPSNRTSPHATRPGADEGTGCPAREPGEVHASYTGAGHLRPDVVQLGPGKLLVADFGVSWRHVHPEARLDPGLNAWLRTFEADETYRMSVVGYTDCHGPDSINIDLRQGRAQAVAGLLGPAARSRTSFVGMAGLGSYVNDNSTVANRARNRGAIIEFNQEISFPAETITAPRHCGPDSTQWLIGQMIANMNHPVIRTSREVQWPNYVPFFNIGWNIGFLEDFRDLVKTGGPWDFKSNQQQWRSGGGRLCPSETCDRTVTLCDRCFNYDVPGNIHYGWVGRMAGLRPWFLHNRAAAAQAGGVDDPHDVVSIDIGIDMAENGGTLCDHITRVGNQLNLDKTTGCPICSTP